MLKHTNSRLECQNRTLFETKMAKIDTLRLTKTGTMHSLWARKYGYNQCKGLQPSHSLPARQTSTWNNDEPLFHEKSTWYSWF